MKTIEIFNYLERIATLLRTDTRKAGIGKGLQPVQLEALHYLSHCNRYSDTPAAVADYLGLTKGTVSQTLNVLEHAGFIEKRPDNKDRRVVHLKLTDRGKKLVEESLPPQILKSALQSTADTDQQAILKGLEQVLRAMQQANQLRSFGQCKYCRHHLVRADESRHCQLTGEDLSDADSEKLCREHEQA